MTPAEILRTYGIEPEVVKCPSGHILFSYTGPFPPGFRVYKKCRSCKKYYEISKR